MGDYHHCLVVGVPFCEVQTIAVLTATESVDTRKTPDTLPVRDDTKEDRYYRPELDWIRFLAFSMVFLLHAFPLSPTQYTVLGVPEFMAERVIVPVVAAGGYGVDLFFALSAFLITKLLLMERDRTGAIHVGSFYVRRVLRIWPLYFAVIGAVTIFELARNENPLGYFVAHWLFVGNWYTVTLGLRDSLIEHMWSVSVEEQFYILWPLLMARLDTKHFASALGLIYIGSSILRGGLVYLAYPDSVPLWCNTFTHLDAFVVGGLLACALHDKDIMLTTLVRTFLFAAAFAIFGQLARYPFAGYFSFYPLWTYPLAAVASGMCILATIARRPTQNTSVIPATASYLGKISYGLYVFHIPAIHLARHIFGKEDLPDDSTWLIRASFAGALTLVASIASYEFFEKPFLHMKQKFALVKSRPE